MTAVPDRPGTRDQAAEVLWAACPFCNIIHGHAPATILEEWDDALAIKPLGPVVPGHVLIIPKRHVRDYLEDSEVTAAAMQRAAEFGNHPSNVITSAGREATQSVQHLHVHIVPRAEGDGLALPWTGQADRESYASLDQLKPGDRVRWTEGGQTSVREVFRANDYGNEFLLMFAEPRRNVMLNASVLLRRVDGEQT